MKRIKNSKVFEDMPARSFCCSSKRI